MVEKPFDFQTDPSSLPHDLRKVPIGLALSGGGYRAAAFHLGTMAYLERVGLLSELRRLSTVSGGTFTGAKYILSLIENSSFSEFFQEFYQFLRDQNLFEAGLTDLSQGPVQVPSGERKIILSLANVYAKTFLTSPQGNAYKFGDILDSSISVEEVIFNSTEFRTGVAFRFQKTKSTEAKIGNGNVSVPRDEAKNIRIADIVAASSCFPGGFEPLSFPNDFAWPGNAVPKNVQDAISKSRIGDSVALMDGGIYDNQGVESLLLADTRTENSKLGLFIISDVDSANDDLFPYPINDSAPSKLTLGKVDWLIRLFLLTCFLTVLSIGYEVWSEIRQGTFIFYQHFFSALIPLILTLLVTTTLWWGRKILRTRILPLIPQVGVNGWQDLKALRVDELFYLIELRFQSLMALTSSVFMDRIKSLIFQRVYTDKLYHNKRISNRIDRLVSRPLNLPSVKPLSSALQKVIESAANMPTTLWLDHPQQLADVTAAGQATICFNLLQYIDREYGEDPSKYPEDILTLWETISKDWDHFNEKPYGLLENLIPDMKFLQD